jgi:phenylalanyl-tRNA synthetase beta subunit
LEIANPLSREQQYLRTTMLPSHLEMARTNQRYKKQFGAFEVARVYSPTTDGELPQEVWKLAVAMVGPDSTLRLKAVLDWLSQYAKVSLDVTPAEDPNYAAGRFASITMADELLGGYGQLSKRVLSSFGVQAEVSFAEISITSVLSQTKQALVADLPEYQIIKRDISIVCQDKVVWSDIRQKVLNSAQISSVEYAGYYQDETLQNVGKKNITLRVGFDLGANPDGDEITKALEGVHLGLQSGSLGEVTIN